MWRIRYRNLYFLFFKPFFNSLSRSWSQPRNNAQLLLALLAGNFTLEKVGFTLRKNVVHLNFKVILQIFNVLEWKSQLFILFSKLVFDFWAGSATPRFVFIYFSPAGAFSGISWTMSDWWSLNLHSPNSVCRGLPSSSWYRKWMLYTYLINQIKVEQYWKTDRVLGFKMP